jgi:hypothetical protein
MLSVGRSISALMVITTLAATTSGCVISQPIEKNEAGLRQNTAGLADRMIDACQDYTSNALQIDPAPSHAQCGKLMASNNLLKAMLEAQWGTQAGRTALRSLADLARTPNQEKMEKLNTYLEPLLRVPDGAAGEIEVSRLVGNLIRFDMTTKSAFSKPFSKNPLSQTTLAGNWALVADRMGLTACYSAALAQGATPSQAAQQCAGFGGTEEGEMDDSDMPAVQPPRNAAACIAAAAQLGMAPLPQPEIPEDQSINDMPDNGETENAAAKPPVGVEQCQGMPPAPGGQFGIKQKRHEGTTIAELYYASVDNGETTMHEYEIKIKDYTTTADGKVKVNGSIKETITTISTEGGNIVQKEDVDITPLKGADYEKVKSGFVKQTDGKTEKANAGDLVPQPDEVTEPPPADLEKSHPDLEDKSGFNPDTVSSDDCDPWMAQATAVFDCLTDPAPEFKPWSYGDCKAGEGDDESNSGGDDKMSPQNAAPAESAWPPLKNSAGATAEQCKCESALVASGPGENWNPCFDPDELGEPMLMDETYTDPSPIDHLNNAAILSQAFHDTYGN